MDGTESDLRADLEEQEEELQSLNIQFVQKPVGGLSPAHCADEDCASLSSAPLRSAAPQMLDQFLPLSPTDSSQATRLSPQVHYGKWSSLGFRLLT